MKFKEFEFGLADANKEFTRNPEIFENAFCDRRGVIDKLINKYEFLLVGRKGVGKSAYSAKIQSISNKIDNEIYAEVMNLSDFEFGTFSKTSIESDITGTQKYKSSWDFILLLNIYKILFNNLEITENEDINKIIFLLDKVGFSLDNEYKSDVTRLSKFKLGIGVAFFDAELERLYNTNPGSYLERLSIITEKMFKGLNKVVLNDRRLVLIIDGLDDILRFRKNKMEIVASLIRSVDYINDKTLQYNQKIKIIVLIREDIISMVNDPDLNKIIQDSSINLSWYNRLEDLKEIVNLRFALSGLTIENSISQWDNMFPKKIKGKTSWNYIIEYTLYKPRDILQFLKYCQIEYPNNEYLTFCETQNVLKKFSHNYFIEEMKNELSGFIDEELIYLIPIVFRRLDKYYDLSDVIKQCNEQSPKKKITDNNIKSMLLYLFDAGYIGLLLPNTDPKEKKPIEVFKHKNPNARIDYNQKFLSHQGLYMGVRL